MPHLTAATIHSWLGCNELVVQPWMIPFLMIVCQVRLEPRAKGCLAYHDHLRQGFFFDRAYEPFAVGIEIRTPRRQDDGLNSAGAQRPVDAMHELVVSVMEQIPFASQEAITASQPTTEAIVSALSSPFCRVRTRVCGVMSGMRDAAAAVSAAVRPPRAPSCECYIHSGCTMCIVRLSPHQSLFGRDDECTWFIAKSYYLASSPLVPPPCDAVMMRPEPLRRPVHAQREAGVGAGRPSAVGTPPGRWRIVRANPAAPTANRPAVVNATP
jgi:hypothetical protein